MKIKFQPLKALRTVCALGVFAGTVTFGIGSHAQPSGPPIKVGAIFSLSGAIADVGAMNRNGVELAAKTINERGGIAGRPLQLIIEDDALAPDKAVTLAQRMINDDKVVAVIGAGAGGATLAVKPIFEAAKVPLLSIIGTMTVTEPKADYVFRVTADDRTVVKNTLRLIANKYPKGRVAMLYDDSAASLAGAALYDKLLPSYPVEVVRREQFGAADTDMTVPLTKLRALKPDVVIVLGFSPSTFIALRNAQQLGMTNNVHFIGALGAGRDAAIKVAAGAAEGIIVPTVYDANNVQSHQRTFDQLWRAAYKGRTTEGGPRLWDAAAYDAVMLIAEAIKISGAATPEGIKTGLEQIKGYQGISAVFTFGFDVRDPITYDSALVWMQVKNGAFVTFKP